MGQISKGILGGFSGTVGTVIGGSWRGIEYMRSRPVRKRSFAPSSKQLDQQVKFALVARFSKTLSGLLETSFKDYAVRMTGRNSCAAYLLKNAITGNSPLFELDYTKVLISRGDLPGAEGATAASKVAGKIAFSWNNNSGIGKSKPGDKAILVAHCPELAQSIYITAGDTRSTGTQVMDAAHFSGKEVHTYIGFISEDEKDIADSIYTGAVTVV